MKKGIVLLLIFSILIASGCGGKQRPDDVREEIWRSGEILYPYLEKGMNGEELTEEEDLQLTKFCDEYGEYILGSPEFSEKETEIIGAIWFMRLAYLRHAVATIDNDIAEKEDSLSAFQENENIFKEIYGL